MPPAMPTATVELEEVIVIAARECTDEEAATGMRADPIAAIVGIFWCAGTQSLFGALLWLARRSAVGPLSVST